MNSQGVLGLLVPNSPWKGREIYLATRDNRDKSVGIATIHLELVLQEGIEILLSSEVLSHGLGESSP